MAGNIDVLIVGAGAAGLTLAVDLQRRGISYRIIDASQGGFEGSRAKGIQPRTAEVFDDLGVLPALKMRSTLYPPLGIHIGPLTIRRTMIALQKDTETVPHSNTLLAPQYATDLSLRETLDTVGGHVDGGVRLVSYEVTASAVRAVLEGRTGTEHVDARYLIGADGGGSSVRRGAGISFAGTTDENDRMIVADLTLSGLSRDRWHIWPRKQGRFMALCPLPDGKFQLMLKLRSGDPEEMNRESMENLIRTFVGSSRLRLDTIHWTSLWRPNIRLAEHYRHGNVFLVGDAAHVHPPTGAQGLNTGVQDAYNLGWKLGQVIAGAPDALLDTYETERQPVAARVLGLSTALYSSMSDRPLAATHRGDEERQLTLSYAGGPLAPGVSQRDGAVVAGDRAPDSTIIFADGSRGTLFDEYRGPHFTLVSIGTPAQSALGSLGSSGRGAGVKKIELSSTDNESFRRNYGIDGSVEVLVRPDGYVAAVLPERDGFALPDGLAMMLPQGSL